MPWEDTIIAPDAHRSLSRGLAGFACLAALAVATPATAQIGGATDIITGHVTDLDGTPLAGVTVEAFSLESEITRRARTDQNGRYTILFPDGGGQYRLRIRAIGYQPVDEIVVRHGDEDRLVWNPALESGAIMLEELTVQGRTRPRRVGTPDRRTPGSTERVLTPSVVARLPIDPADINLLATLVPGVVGLDATDSTAQAFSVAGLGPEANALTLDGLIFGSGDVPQEAVRQTRVITSTYDVARGQFSGGLLAATTRSGTNRVQGSSQYSLRDDDLAASGQGASAFEQGFTQHFLSAGLGGPIARDRLFVFGAGQLRVRNDAQQTLLTADQTDLARLGVHPDSVARFLGIVDSLGVPSAATVDGRSRNNLSALVRFDFLASNAHTLSLRGDWRGTASDPTRLGPLALPETGGSLETSGGGGMLSLSSRLGTRVINDARVYLQADRRIGDPYLYLPQGRVQVASALDDGATSVSTLVFGGNPGLPTSNQTSRLEVADEVSWLAGRGHRLKLGGFFASRRQDILPAANQWGVYPFNSLGDLEASQAASFRRTIAVAERQSRQRDWAIYAGDVWLASPAFQLTYGVRLEGGGFGAAPPHNAGVDSVFGRRTDALPSEWHLSPRAGFTLSVGGERARGRLATPPTLVIRGGLGEFRSPVPASLVGQAYGATGLDAGGQEITCIGLSVPPPDWGAFAADPATIPSACRSIAPVPPGPARTVTLFAPGFSASRAWRASLGIQRSLSSLFRLSLDGSFARGVAQAGYRDLNLDADPVFGLPAEGQRPVYVPLLDIAPPTGAVRFTGSRIDPAFGHVLELHSDLATESWQATLGVGGILGRGIQVRASYTLQHASDQGSSSRFRGGFGGGFGGATTAGNPNLAEWARSGFERRHQVLATLTYPFGTSLEVTSIARFMSGAPFTPLVASDINGDGARNDRAFIFPRESGPEGEAIARLIETGSPTVSSCLGPRVGAVAERNACTGPWQASLDFQLNWRPTFLGLNRRLSISVVTVNFLRGVDEILHGKDGAKGWGVAARPDPTLLYVTGFDPTSQRFAYQVNERFGATGGSANAFRPPFQIGIQARFTVGPDRRRQALDALRGGGRGGIGGGAGRGGFGPGARGGIPGAAGGADAIARRLELLPNPASFVLERRATLDLTDEQIAPLEALRDSLMAHNAGRAASLREALEQEGENPELARIVVIARPILEEARQDIDRMHGEVRAILSDAQWQRLPEGFRDLQRRLRPGRRQ
jgi:hypothetical protein